MKTRQEIFEELKDSVVSIDTTRKEVIEKCDESTNLVSGLGFDSVGLICLVIVLEERFGIRFDDSDGFETVGQVIDYIEGKLG